MVRRKRERIIYFDLIKLVATICVFVCHFTRSLEANAINFSFKVLPDNIFSVYLGSFGVSLFFIVSGAALMYVYDEKIDIKNYFVKRFKGIYPLYWLTYLFAFFITFYLNAGIVKGIPKYRIIYSILGCDGNVLWFKPTFYMVGEWFLSVIVLLYVIFPICRLGIKKIPYVTMLLAVLIFVCLHYTWSSSMPLECLFLARLPEFVFGMFFVKVIKKPRWWLFVPGVLVWLAALRFEEKLLNLDSVIRMEVIGIASFCVLSYVFMSLKGKIITKLSVFVNKYMYGFFLTHHFIQEQVLKKFSGVTLERTEVILACIMCMVLTVTATVLLSKLNDKILKGFSELKRS